jgi:hypothetical protein
MDSETEKIIAEQMNKLPEDVVAAIISVDYKAKLQDITKRQKLMIDQIGKVEMETTLVMLGLEPVADFAGNLQRELEVTAERAKEIATDISENIFKPIRVSLKKMNDAEFGIVDDDMPPDSLDEEPPATKFTNSNNTDLNRDQILNEIENPTPYRSAIVKTPENIPTEQKTAEVEASPVAIKTNQEIAIVPNEGVKNIDSNILESKLAGPAVNVQQIINAKPESKLPEITKPPLEGEKKRPSSGIDPYREPLS